MDHLGSTSFDFGWKLGGSDKLPWEVTIVSPSEGRLLSLQTFMLCCVLHGTLALFAYPVLVTILTNRRYSLATLNKLAIKSISAVFDAVAVAGAIKELVTPEPAIIADPIYGFSSHSEFHFAVASGFFSWAFLATLIFGPKLLPLLHHFCCALIYMFTLRPFLHHTGNVFLLFQASTLVLDLHSIGRIIGAPSSGANRTLRIIHPFVFFLSRISVGVPLSYSFVASMLRLLWTRNGHSVLEISFMLITNVFMNSLSVYWFIMHLMGGDLGDCSSVGESTSMRRGSSSTDNFFTTQFSYKSKKPQMKPRAPTVTLRAVRAFLMGFTIVAAVSIYRYSNFILAPPELDSYIDVLHGDGFREKSGEAARRAESIVEELERRAGDELLGNFIERNIGGNTIDIVISGGGFRGQYAGGALSILALLQERGALTIDRWAGTSIGACTASSFALGVPFEKFFRVPYAWQGVWSPWEFWKGGPIVREMMEHTLGDNPEAHVTLSGKLFVSVSVFDGIAVKNELVSEFESKKDLVDSLVAGAAIPGFTGEPFFASFRGRVAMDGGVTLNTPVFKDALNPQIVVNLGYVKYSLANTFGPVDRNHEVLVYQGMDDALNLLSGRGEVVKALQLVGRGEGGTDKGETRPMQTMFDMVAHIVEYDIVPWTTHGFAKEVLSGFAGVVGLLYALGVYDALI